MAANVGKMEKKRRRRSRIHGEGVVQGHVLVVPVP